MEKPNEPLSSCKVRIINGYEDIVSELNKIKEVIYVYNSEISNKGYYLKPVHKVYKLKNRNKIIYEYYGRYWWKKLDKKLIYSGVVKPKILPSPPENPIEGLSIIREGNDIVIDCNVYEKFKWVFKNKKIERTW